MNRFLANDMQQAREIAKQHGVSNKELLTDVGMFGLDFSPVADAKALAYDLPKQVSEGDYAGGMLSLASILPVVGKAAKHSDIFTSRFKLPATTNDINGGMVGANAKVYDIVKNKNKNVKAQVFELTPDEYLERSAKILNKPKKELEQTIRQGDRYDDMVELAISKNDDIQMPYLDYASKGQEGNHRALVAKDLGAETIPVLVIRKAN